MSRKFEGIASGSEYLVVDTGGDKTRKVQVLAKGGYWQREVDEHDEFRCVLEVEGCYELSEVSAILARLLQDPSGGEVSDSPVSEFEDVTTRHYKDGKRKKGKA